jgi:hypothetical protein
VQPSHGSASTVHASQHPPNKIANQAYRFQQPGFPTTVHKTASVCLVLFPFEYCSLSAWFKSCNYHQQDIGYIPFILIGLYFVFTGQKSKLAFEMENVSRLFCLSVKTDQTVSKALVCTAANKLIVII